MHDATSKHEHLMMEPYGLKRDRISFGPFNLFVSERLLTNEGKPVQLGARALDILIALISRSNGSVTKAELLNEVWPGVTVGESSLRFHMTGLRKALRDGQGGARYISTLAGRGYCFVAPIERSNDPQAASANNFSQLSVPGRLARMVGRSDGILRISSQLVADRFVTVVGSGGVGKTTVAVAVAHDLIERFAGVVLFIDLGTLNDPALVAPLLASLLGLPVQSADPAASVVAYLRDRRMLLVLDNCEHVIEAAAALAARLFVTATQVHVLATSREPLRVEGEHVHRLLPLACPPDEPGLTLAVALEYPAIQLFVERAAASGARLDLSDADAVLVAGICRKLDGVALAIELTAARVEAYGLQQTAALLEERLSLLWQGQRSAPLRQQTLKATLDWSYGLLSVLEQRLLRELAVFVGDFTIEAALAVVTSVDQGQVFAAVDSLVAKSMVATRPVGAMMRYRLLDMTKAYALEFNIDEAGLEARHAAYFRLWLEQTGSQWPTLSTAAARAPHLAALGNVRTALEWCFSLRGNAAIGISLAAAATPVFLAMSLLIECHRWSAQAILVLEDGPRGGPEEMHLQTALGLSLMFTRGTDSEAGDALYRALAIAEERGDTANQLQLFGRLHQFHQRLGDCKSALQCATRGSAVAGTLGDPNSLALAHSFLGIALQLAGELRSAGSELAAALQRAPGARRTSTILQGSDHHIIANAYLARNLWLEGHPGRAIERTRQNVEDAASMGQPVTLSVALVCATSVFLWTDELGLAEDHTDWLIAHAQSHSIAPSIAAGRGFKGELAIRRGDAINGIESLQFCLQELRRLRYGLLIAPFSISLGQGLAAIDRAPEALRLINETIILEEANGGLCYLPEMLRMKGRLHRSITDPNEAELCFKRSLELSRSQGARAWELRTAVDLAALWAVQQRSDKARTLLEPLIQKFTEARENADIKSAEHLLANLA